MAGLRALLPKRVELHPSLPVLLALLCWLGQEQLLEVFGGSALLHECGHLLAAGLLGVPVSHFRLSALGGELRTEGLLPRWKESLILAAGPGSNLLETALCLALERPVWAGSALLLALVNLLPAEPLDGGGLLRLLLEALLPLPLADRAMKSVTLLTGGSLLLLGVYFFAVLRASPALAVLGGWILAGRGK